MLFWYQLLGLVLFLTQIIDNKMLSIRNLNWWIRLSSMKCGENYTFFYFSHHFYHIFYSIVFYYDFFSLSAFTTLSLSKLKEPKIQKIRTHNISAPEPSRDARKIWKKYILIFDSLRLLQKFRASRTTFPCHRYLFNYSQNA